MDQKGVWLWNQNYGCRYRVLLTIRALCLVMWCQGTNRHIADLTGIHISTDTVVIAQLYILQIVKVLTTKLWIFLYTWCWLHRQRSKDTGSYIFIPLFYSTRCSLHRHTSFCEHSGDHTVIRLSRDTVLPTKLYIYWRHNSYYTVIHLSIVTVLTTQ